MTTSPSCSLIAVALAAIAACDAAPEPLDDPAEYQRMFAEQYCAQITTCDSSPGWDYERCHALFDWSDADEARFRDLEAEGIAAFDATQAGRCLDAIAAEECPTTLSIGGDPQAIDLGLDDASACVGVFVYRNPGAT